MRQSQWLDCDASVKLPSLSLPPSFAHTALTNCVCDQSLQWVTTKLQCSRWQCSSKLDAGWLIIMSGVFFLMSESWENAGRKWAILLSVALWGRYFVARPSIILMWATWMAFWGPVECSKASPFCELEAWLPREVWGCVYTESIWTENTTVVFRLPF